MFAPRRGSCQEPHPDPQIPPWGGGGSTRTIGAPCMGHDGSGFLCGVWSAERCRRMSQSSSRRQTGAPLQSCLRHYRHLQSFSYGSFAGSSYWGVCQPFEIYFKNTGVGSGSRRFCHDALGSAQHVFWGNVIGSPMLNSCVHTTI